MVKTECPGYSTVQLFLGLILCYIPFSPLSGELQRALSLQGASSWRLVLVFMHEHCTVAEILAFGRETAFSRQKLQRWYMYKSPQGMDKDLIDVF